MSISPLRTCVKLSRESRRPGPGGVRPLNPAAKINAWLQFKVTSRHRQSPFGFALSVISRQFAVLTSLDLSLQLWMESAFSFSQAVGGVPRGVRGHPLPGPDSVFHPRRSQILRAQERGGRGSMDQPGPPAPVREGNRLQAGGGAGELGLFPRLHAPGITNPWPLGWGLG